MSITSTLILFLMLFSNVALAKAKGQLALEIIPSQTKYDDPNLDITLTGKAKVAKDYQELTMDWILPPEVELVQGNLATRFNDVKVGDIVSTEIVVNFKSNNWKVVLSVYELQDGAKHGTTQILTAPETEKVIGQSIKAVNINKAAPPYSLKGLKIIH